MKNGTSHTTAKTIEIHERILSLCLTRKELMDQLASINEDIDAANDELHAALGHEVVDIGEASRAAEGSPDDSGLGPKPPDLPPRRVRGRSRRGKSLAIYNAVRKETSQVGKLRAYLKAVKRPVPLEEIRRQAWCMIEGNGLSRTLNMLSKRGEASRVGHATWQWSGND